MKKIINMFRYTKQDEIISSIMNGFYLSYFHVYYAAGSYDRRSNCRKFSWWRGFGFVFLFALLFLNFMDFNTLFLSFVVGKSAVFLSILIYVCINLFSHSRLKIFYCFLKTSTCLKMINTLLQLHAKKK